MQEPMRRTGIDVIGDVPWGTHLCQFYESRQDLADILVPYFQAGLAANEFCMWITSRPLDADDALSVLRECVPDLDERLRKGQMEILDYTQWYTRNGRFSAADTLQGWIDRLEGALRRGYEGLRLSGNTFWLEKADWPDFTAYEETINRVIGRYRMIALCTYCLDRCGAGEIMDVVSNHRVAILKRNARWHRIESSERRHAEESLRVERDKLRAVVDNVNVGVGITAPDGTTLSLNAEGLRIHGFASEAEMFAQLAHYVEDFELHYPDGRIMPPEDWPARRAMRGEYVRDYEVILTRRSTGLRRHVSYTVVPILDRDGREILRVFNMADFTARRQAEAALMRAKHLSDALNRVHDAVHATLDPDDILRRLVTEGGKAMECESAAVSLRDAGTWVVRYVYGMPDSVIGTVMTDDEERHAVLAVEIRQPVAVSDTSRDARVNREHLRRYGIRSVLVMPLVSRDGPVGALFFNYHSAPHAFEDDHLRFAGQLAAAASVALDNSRLYLQSRRAEDALRESEERFRLFMNNSPTLAWVKDEHGRYVYLSKTGEERLGIRPDSWHGKTDADLWPPETANAFGRNDQAVLNGDRAVEVIAQTTDAYGNRTSWLSAKFPFRNSAGQRFVGGITLDITARKEAEDALRRSEERHRLLAETMLQGVVHQDAGGTIIAMNPAAERILGKTREDFLGSNSVREEHDTVREDGSPFPGMEHPSMVALRTGQVQSGVVMGVFNPRLRQRRWIRVTAVPLFRPGAARPAEVYTVFEDFTARREIQEELKRTRQQEQEAVALAAASRTAVDILEAMGEGVLLLDMEGRIVSVNPGMTRISGIPTGETVGRPIRALFTEVLSPADQAIAEAALAEALEGRRPAPVSMTILRRGGGRTPVIPSVAFVGAPGAQPGQIVITVRDISELRAAQASLEESNALLERVFDNTHMCIAYLDRAFNFVRVNRAYADACRQPPEFFPGKNHFALYPHAENETIFRRVIETGEAFEIHEKPFEFPDHPEWGVTYWDWSLKPLKGPAGHVENLLFCLLDRTERVQARLKLVESEHRYRELVENANSIILRITPEYRITFFNEYAQRFFGYEAREVIGRSVIGTIVPPVDSEGRDLREMVRAVTDQPDRYGSNENENVCKDGRRVWVHWANRAIRDTQGRVSEILCVGTDITERRRLEGEAALYRQRLRELADRLAATEEQERRRVSSQIHDTVIQTLSLANIRLGALRKAFESAGLPDECPRVDQVRVLLDAGTSECRGLMAELTPPLLYELGLGPALRDFARKQQKLHGIAIMIDEDDHPAPMDAARRGLLFQSARELIMNAIKHSGTRSIAVSLTCSTQDIRLQVRDRGRGFDPSVLDRQVTDFEHGGFGIFNIRERLLGIGGQLEIDSAPGKGTAVTLRIPLTDPPAPQEPQV